MPDRWYLKTISQDRTATGEAFNLHTNTPCHLWMRWTLIPPPTHRIMRLRRGLALKDDLYWCFDVYEDNEQTEAGDTLDHTFIKEPWPYCQARWYYYHGEINGIPSPSCTPIFFKHPKLPTPPWHYHTYKFAAPGILHTIAGQHPATPSLCPLSHLNCQFLDFDVQEAILAPDASTHVNPDTEGHTHQLTVNWSDHGYILSPLRPIPCPAGHPNCKMYDYFAPVLAVEIKTTITAPGHPGHHRHTFQSNAYGIQYAPYGPFYTTIACPSGHPKCALTPIPAFDCFVYAGLTWNTSYEITAL